MIAAIEIRSLRSKPQRKDAQVYC